MALEVGDIVLCTVDRIVGTVVFVKIDGDGEGSIILSEIAPGRIRNLRDFVVPKKRIVCKVLRISGDRIDLSLRRVTQKEQKEVNEKFKLEQTSISILKSVLKEGAESAIQKILLTEKVHDFLEEAKLNGENLEKLVGKENSEKILAILGTQKQKKFEIKKEINLSTTDSDGLDVIKTIFVEAEGLTVKYLAGGKYSISVETTDPKSAEVKINKFLESIEDKSKKLKIDFKVREK